MPTENIELDTTEDNESDSDVEADVRDIQLQEIRRLSPTEKAAVAAAGRAAKGIRADSALLRNTIAVASNDRNFNSRAFSSASSGTSTSDVAVRSEISDAEEAQRDIADAQPKGKLYTRWKFWSIIIPAIVSTVPATIVSILAYLQSRQALAMNQTPTTDVAALPQDLTDLLDKKAAEWSSMAVSDAFDKVSDLVGQFDLSLQAQILLMGDLSSLTFPAQSSALLADSAAVEGMVDALVGAYGATSQGNRSVALYAKAETLNYGTPPRNLTVYETAQLCQLALSQLYTLWKAKQPQPNQVLTLYAAPGAAAHQGYHRQIMTAFPQMRRVAPAPRHPTQLPVKLIRLEDVAAGLSAAAVRGLALRREEAIRFWGDRLPLLPGETVTAVDVGVLEEGFGDHPKGSLAIERTTSAGSLVLVNSQVLLSLDAGRLVIASRQYLDPTASARQARRGPQAMAAGVTVQGVLGEVAQVASLIGMVAIKSYPVAGVAVMIGGQVLDWVFGLLGGQSSAPPPVPSKADIEAAVNTVVKSQHIQDLTDEALSVWADLKTAFDRGFSPNASNNDHDLSQFEATLERGTNTGQVGNVHDCVNQLQSHFNDLDPGDSHPTGGPWLPAFMVAANVEILCLQNKSFVALAKSGAGIGPDKKLNQAFRDTLTDLKNRLTDLADWLDHGLKAMQANTTARLSVVSDTLEEVNVLIAQVGGVPVPGPRIYTLYLTDVGTFPPPDAPRTNLATYQIYDRCCSLDDSEKAPAEAAAAAARVKYRAVLQTRCGDAFGTPDLPSQQDVLTNWRAALADTEASIQLLP